MTIKNLYEDNHVIAVVKPAGVLSQGDLSGQTSMYGLVKNYLKEKKNKKTPSNPSGQAGNVFLGIVHRLDRPVFGILLFAKTSKGASRLSEQFRNKTVEKTYHALVAGKPKNQKGVLVNFIGKDEKLLKAKEYADGREAVLHYETVKTNGTYSLLKITIEGGQFHQIRVQLSLAGMPIVGDVKYGGERWDNLQAIALCATGLSFNYATEDKKIELAIESPTKWQDYLSTE